MDPRNKNLKIVLHTDISQDGISLVDGDRLLLPVIHRCVERIERGASSILVDGEVLVSATPHLILLLLQVSQNVHSLLHGARRHELLGPRHAVQLAIIINIIHHRQVKHVRVEVRPLRHRRPHSILRNAR